jgi:hypothetical protein
VHWADARGIAALPAALAHDDSEVVKAAVALARGNAGLVEPLRRLLSHPAWDVRHAAVLALAPTDRAAIVAHRKVETDDLVLTAIDAALSGETGLGGGT